MAVTRRVRLVGNAARSYVAAVLSIQAPITPLRERCSPMFVSQIKDATPQANGQSDLRHLLAFNPNSTQHLLAFTQLVMRGGPLSPGECELIAAITSQQNRCGF